MSASAHSLGNLTDYRRGRHSSIEPHGRKVLVQTHNGRQWAHVNGEPDSTGAYPMRFVHPLSGTLSKTVWVNPIWIIAMEGRRVF